MNRRCIFIDIISSIPDQNENTNNIDGYSQVTNGILIRNFVIGLLNMKKDQVKIFAYGNEQHYDQYIYTNDKCYHQFELNDIFQMNAESPGFDFKYFDNFTKILLNIDDIIQKDKYKFIILFLDDHGSKGKFSKKAYFQLYKIILKYPSKCFFIFNDSSFSGSLIKLIELYKKIYEMKIEDEICLKLIFSFINLFKSILEKEEINYPIKEAKRLVRFYQNCNLSDQNKFTIFLDLINSRSKSIEEIGLQNNDELNDLKLVYDSFESNEDNHNEEINKYIKSREIFTMPNLELMITLIDGNLQEFISVVDDIIHENKENISFQIPPNQNIEIITSTDHQNKSFSFSSIRTNGITKVYPGSPAMGSFIKEIFMKFDESPLCFENIRKEMCGSDENKMLCYSVKVQGKSIHGHVKKDWAYLLPQNYKPNKENDLSLSFSENAKRNIAALRAISFVINKKFQKLSKNLSDEINPIVYNHIIDPMADMVAIASILNDNSNIDEVLDNSINVNILFKEKELFGLDLILSIIEFAFYSSKDKVKMVAVIINCLKAAIKKEINKSIISINNGIELEMPITKFILKNEFLFYLNDAESLFTCNSESIFTDNVEGEFTEEYDDENNNENDKKLLKKMIKEDEKNEIISEVENAIFALLKPASIFYAYLVAASILDDINFEKIQESDFISDGFYQKFMQGKNINSLKEPQLRKFAEHGIFSHVKLSLDLLNSICDMHIKNDTMKIVSSGLQKQNSLFLVKFLVENIGDEVKNSFIQKVINPIEEIISSRKIPTFFMPAIIELISMDQIIYALYASLSYLQDNWFDNLIRILKESINCKEYEIINCQYVCIGGLLQWAEKMLDNQKDIHEKSKYEAEIHKMKEKYIKEIDLSIKKIIKLIQISVRRVRGNISRMMNMEILENRISECCSYFESVEKNSYHNKFHDYLYSAISEFLEEVNTYKKSRNIDESINEGFDEIESLKNTDDLYKKAAIELNTVAHIFQISDQSLYDSNKQLSKLFTDEEKRYFQVSIMFARSLNIVEMSPIACLLDSYSKNFDPSKGNNPSIKEIMGLFGANIYILSVKDKVRKRSKLEIIKPSKKKDGENNFESEYDSYYSSDDDVNDIPYRPAQIKYNKESIKTTNNLRKIMYHKEQISQGDIQDFKKS